MFISLLLSEEDMFGYQIKQELEKRLNGMFIVKEGTIALGCSDVHTIGSTPSIFTVVNCFVVF